MARAQKRDGGFGWIICFSFFIVEILVDGIRFSYGLYFVEFLAEFKASKAKTAWIGGTLIGVYNVCGPVFAFIVNKLGYRKASVLGTLIGTVGLITSSFVKELYQLYFCYGALQGFGYGLVFLSGTVAISRYFLKKRALSIAISYCGGGVGLFAIPPLTRFLLETYSWRGSLFILAGLILNCSVLSALYRPFHWSEEIDIEVLNKDDIDKPLENGNPFQSTNGGVQTEIQASPLLDNGNNLAKNGTMRRSKPLSPSMPRSFAELRMEQTKNLKDGSDVASQRSITKAMLSQSIFGSHASFDYIVDKRHKNSQMNVQRLDIDDIDSVIDNDGKRFKISFIELMFPKQLVTNMNFIIMMIATFLVGVPSFIPYSMLPDYAISSGTKQSEVAWLLSAMGIGGTFGRIGAGVLSDMKCVHSLTLNSVCYIMTGASLLVTAVYPSFEVLLTFSVIFGIFFGAIYVVQPAVLLEYIGEEFVSEFMGIVMCVYGVSSFIGSPIAGWIFDVTGSYRTTFLVAGIMNVLGGVVNFMALCTKCKRRNTTDENI